MKRIVLFILLLSLSLLSCSKDIIKNIDKDTLANLKTIYEKEEKEESFDNWLKSFDSYDITYSDNYTYIIGSVDTNINIFSYESFMVDKDDYWVVDGIKTHVKLYEPSNKENLCIEYGDNGNWFINKHDTLVKIIYRDLKVKINLNGARINDDIKDEYTVKEGTFFTLPKISSDDYKFLYWSIDNDFSSVVTNEIKVTSNINLFAIWEHPYLVLEILDNQDLAVKGIKRDIDTLNIPETFNSHKITTINSLFLKDRNIKDVYIPNNVKYVFKDAFKDVYNLNLYVGSIEQTLNWDKSWRDDSYITLNFLNDDVDDYYLEDEVELTDYFKKKTSGSIPSFSVSDASINREFYYWSSGVTSTEYFNNEGINVNILKANSLSSYILQVNDLNGTMPLTVGLKYTISLKIKPDKANTTIALSIHTNNNQNEAYYKEHKLNASTYNELKCEFIVTDPKLFFKIYMGKYIASYTIKDIKISCDYMEYIKKEIDNSIPKNIYNSFTLPEFENDELSISYLTNYSSIIDNSFIYFVPKEKEDVVIKTIIKYKGKTYYMEFNSVIKSPLKKIPEIHITLDNEDTISNTDEYTKLVLDFIEYDVNKNKVVSLSQVTGGIRIRGNSTRTFPKKAYRIKFDSKQSFFNLDKAKSWVLLANHADQSLMRDYLAYNLAQEFDNLDFSPSAYFVDLYVNDEYYGNYLLTEQMQVGKGRVDIESDGGEVDTGYFLEYDFHIEDEVEGVDYFNIDESDSVYFIKSPERSDGLTDEQFNYIKNYLISVDTAIKNRSGYLELIDIDSFVDFFILQELFKNIDCNQGSIYLTKEKGEKLKLGPIWDFDLSCGNDRQDNNAVRTDGWFSFLSYKNQWWYNLMKEKEVVDLFIARWHEMYPVILEMIDSISDTYQYIKESAERNFEIHDYIGKEWNWYTVDRVYAIKTYEGQVEYLKDWLTERVKWINNNIDSLKINN